MSEGLFKKRIAEHNKDRVPIFNPSISTVHQADAFCNMIDEAKREFHLAVKCSEQIGIYTPQAVRDMIKKWFGGNNDE